MTTEKKIKTPTATRTPNGYAVRSSCDCYAAWQEQHAACAYDALHVVFSDEESAAAFAEPDGSVIPCYWVNGPQGFVVWTEIAA